jgi:hypothetical protein
VAAWGGVGRKNKLKEKSQRRSQRPHRYACTYCDDCSASHVTPSWSLTCSLRHINRLQTQMLLHARQQIDAAQAQHLLVLWRNGSGSRPITGPSQPSQQPDSPGHSHPRSQSHQNMQLSAVLRRRQMKNEGPARLNISISRPTARAGHSLQPKMSFICIELTGSAIFARCNTHLRPPCQDFRSGRHQIKPRLLYGSM